MYVADSLGDTVSVVEIKSGMRAATISLGPRPEATAALRGERLFYSAKLSHDGWMSCHSCHSDGHTNNLVSDTLGRRIIWCAQARAFAIGVAATGPWTWTGSVARLEDQVGKSIATTMHGTKLLESQIADLKAYLEDASLPLRTRAVCRSRFAGSATVRRGFRGAKVCGLPHVARVHITWPIRRRASDEVGNHEFNPPSLRGVSNRDSFLHDGRSRSLEEVFRKAKHPRGLG